MPCYRPIKAYRHAGGDIGFAEQGGDLESLELGCGRCVGCRLTRASSWSVRCQHEAQLFARNSFVTLTYDDDHVPQYGSLEYADVQKFFKRLRKRERGFEPSPSGRYPIRFFMAGEYGEQSYRPHYHLLLFNFEFQDKQSWGENTFRSPSLEALWPFGSSLLGSVTPASAAYVARYALKKVYGRQASAKFYTWTDKSTGEVSECRPEFCVMSRKPGIGAWWYDRYQGDVLPNDYAVVEGHKVKVPRYYQNRFAEKHPELYEEVKHARYLKLKSMPVEERSAARRAAQEAVKVAELKHFHGERGF